MRLQRHLAACGLGSRRGCEELIRAGRVCVNGSPATVLGVQVAPETDEVTVDGRRVIAQGPAYFMLHKTPGVISTSRDPQGRPTVVQQIAGANVRLFAVGRLDAASEGLVLLTNDGDLAFRLLHPRHEVCKTYRVTLARPLTRRQWTQLVAGVPSEGQILRLKQIRRARPTADPREPCYEIVLGEGRKRQIRRMMTGVGNAVTRLIRTAIGPLELGPLPPGHSRPLSPPEIQALLKHTPDEFIREGC